MKPLKPSYYALKVDGQDRSQSRKSTDTRTGSSSNCVTSTFKSCKHKAKSCCGSCIASKKMEKCKEVLSCMCQKLKNCLCCGRGNQSSKREELQLNDVKHESTKSESESTKKSGKSKEKSLENMKTKAVEEKEIVNSNRFSSMNEMIEHIQNDR